MDNLVLTDAGDSPLTADVTTPYDGDVVISIVTIVTEVTLWVHKITSG